MHLDKNSNGGVMIYLDDDIVFDQRVGVLMVSVDACPGFALIWNPIFYGPDPSPRYDRAIVDALKQIEARWRDRQMLMVNWFPFEALWPKVCNYWLQKGHTPVALTPEVRATTEAAGFAVGPAYHPRFLGL